MEFRLTALSRFLLAAFLNGCWQERPVGVFGWPERSGLSSSKQLVVVAGQSLGSLQVSVELGLGQRVYLEGCRTGVAFEEGMT